MADCGVLVPLAPGTKLGPYEIQSVAGAGGMGEVYRARDTRLDRTVAVKVLRTHLSSSPELKQAFENFMQKYGSSAGQKPLSTQERETLFANFMKFLNESKVEQAAAR